MKGQTMKGHPMTGVSLILISLMMSLMACDAENNPTTMKGRTITPARLPKIHPMTLPKVPDSVRDHLSGTSGRTPAPMQPKASRSRR